MSTMQRLMVVTREKLAIATTPADKECIMKMVIGTQISATKSIFKLIGFHPVSTNSFDEFWSKSIILEPETGYRTACISLYDHYLRECESKGATTMSKKQFGQAVGGKGYISRVFNGIRYYVGIRLRTVDDPIPKFPFESETPYNVRKLGYVILQGSRNYDPVDPAIKETVRKWMKDDTLEVGFSGPFTRFDDLFDAFLQCTGSQITSTW